MKHTWTSGVPHGWGAVGTSKDDGHPWGATSASYAAPFAAFASCDAQAAIVSSPRSYVDLISLFSALPASAARSSWSARKQSGSGRARDGGRFYASLSHMRSQTQFLHQVVLSPRSRHGPALGCLARLWRGAPWAQTRGGAGHIHGKLLAVLLSASSARPRIPRR